MLTVTLYTRKNDARSDQTREDLISLQEEYPHRLVEVDVDTDPAIQKKYGDQTPVVEAGPYRLSSPFDKQKLTMTLGAAGDRRGQLDKLGREDHHDRLERGGKITAADRVMYWISKHYLAALNIAMFFYFGLPILAPVLMNAGAATPANIIYTVYKPLCHQFGFRSFFLFGEQLVYPLEEAHVSGLITFEEATGFKDIHNPAGFGRYEAREFIGNQTMGFKTALCERDMAIYSAMFLFGILYAVSGRKIKPLHWMLWILIGMGPIGVDGFSQLFSQMDWAWLSPYLPYRESIPFFRVLTGALFGFATAWFAYPSIEESMTETRQFFFKKFAAVENK
jgi:uncharacterized membrane protein